MPFQVLCIAISAFLSLLMQGERRLLENHQLGHEMLHELVDSFLGLVAGGKCTQQGSTVLLCSVVSLTNLKLAGYAGQGLRQGRGSAVMSSSSPPAHTLGGAAMTPAVPLLQKCLCH